MPLLASHALVGTTRLQFTSNRHETAALRLHRRPPPPHWKTHRHCLVRATNQRDDLGDVADILKKYGGNGSGLSSTSGRAVPAAGAQQAATRKDASSGMGNGLFAILLLNFALFGAANLLHWAPLTGLALNHWRPQWWQFVTATFVHANWQHLSSNAFALLVFGRMVEEEEGVFGLWATYLLAGVGGCIASYLTSPHTHTTSLGASGAVFGCFMVGVLTKFQPSIRKLLEMAILGTFVSQQVLSEFQNATGGGVTVGGMQVGHIAHLAGAAVGVLLVVLLSRLPAAAE
ncbi:Rhomboid-like protein 11 [Chlorella vulgaris]